MRSTSRTMLILAIALGAIAQAVALAVVVMLLWNEEPGAAGGIATDPHRESVLMARTCAVLATVWLTTFIGHHARRHGSSYAWALLTAIPILGPLLALLLIRGTPTRPRRSGDAVAGVAEFMGHIR